MWTSGGSRAHEWKCRLSVFARHSSDGRSSGDFGRSSARDEFSEGSRSMGRSRHIAAMCRTLFLIGKSYDSLVRNLGTCSTKSKVISRRKRAKHQGNDDTTPSLQCRSSFEGKRRYLIIFHHVCG